jgi:hypothetical protein
MHIARCAQTNVCEGIRVTIENQRAIYQYTGYVESTLTLQTHELEFLVLVILPNMNIPSI